jgi:hypothetical protein
VKDYREHPIATLFGQVKVRLPRFRCAACGTIGVGIDWPSHCRSTPELDRLQAHLSALMTYRTAADVLEQMFPVGTGRDKETLRRHTLRAGAALRDNAAIRPETPAAAITVTVDSTFIRNYEDGERHLEVRVGNVETASGGRQVFGAVARSGTDIEMLIRRSLDAVGRTEASVLTAFTDGCLGLRRILADAGVTGLPILDWFHIGMRLQHLKQIARALTSDGLERVAAKAVIVVEVERLHWRIWNGKAKNAQISIDRIRAVMQHFQGEPGDRAPSGHERPLRGWRVYGGLLGKLVVGTDRRAAAERGDTGDEHQRARPHHGRLRTMVTSSGRLWTSTVAVCPGTRRRPGGTWSMTMRTGMRCARRTQVKDGLTLASCASPPARSRSSTPPAMLSTWPLISFATPIR